MMQLAGRRPLWLRPLDDPFLGKAERTYSEAVKGFVSYMPGTSSAAFSFMERCSVNAVANVIGPNAFVGLNLGTPMILLDLFSALLSSPSFLPDRGESTAESILTGCYEPPIGWSSFDKENEPAFRSPRWRPNSPSRRKLAHMLAAFGTDFLFVHELCHLLRGHIPLVRRQCAFLGEKDSLEAFGGSREISEKDALILQTLEYDADWFSIRILLNAPVPEILVSSEYRHPDESPQEVLCLVLTAVMLAVVVGSSAASRAISPVRAHPEGPWRIITLYVACGELVRTHQPDWQPFLMPAFQQAFLELNRASLIYPAAGQFLSDVSRLRGRFEREFGLLMAMYQELSEQLAASPFHFRTGSDENEGKSEGLSPSV